MSDEHIQIAINVEKDALPPLHEPLTLLEKLAIRLGGPVKVGRACGRLNVAISVAALAYGAGLLATEVVLMHRGHLAWSLGKSLLLAFAWTPLIPLQLAVFGLRFACTTLELKAADQMSRATAARFHDQIGRMVGEALERHHAGQTLPAGPTLQ